MSIIYIKLYNIITYDISKIFDLSNGG